MCFYKRHTTGVLHFMVRIPLINIENHPIGWSSLLAERVGFEPTVGYPITSFQDWLLKPLGHLSMGKIIPSAKKKVKEFHEQ